jgi:hypothetical protein
MNTAEYNSNDFMISAPPQVPNIGSVGRSSLNQPRPSSKMAQSPPIPAKTAVMTP